MQETKKNKIINDPIYGFITLERGIVFDLIEHPFFQRLRRITQLGLSYLVYPGAYHTRFHHALGCMFLMEKAILQIRNKEHEISSEEEEALKIAILLHDIGHGPFSHALENSIANNISHEDLSKLFMAKLNKEFDGKLSLAIQIFNNKHSKKFLHQLVSSQLDMDRLDYLKRDSFFTGVTEGNIGTERIINMLNVVNDQLVIEEKGIYSIEKFLIARRLMYWQVYLHKTVVSAENTLIKILKRAKQLIQNGTDIFSSSALKMFLKNNYTADNFIKNDDILEIFSKLDDHDIYSCLKEWANHDDFILSSLSIRILNRKPLKIKTQNEKFLEKEINKLKQKVSEKYNISIDDTNYLVFTGKVSNNAYQYHKTHINILMKNGEIKDITDASDQFNIDALSKTVNKYFLCYPKM
ncbi:MAG: HD domain-containing protein [Flavobacteriales bacterium]|nr:HD domain-containing protein [Flavobacteriales bacterium]MBT6699282.1 HD domain-containing protein [Flavobacteriales bacterium]MBT6815262.1 HD domain-containing protein [Flavobacteriales bacterium]MBT7620466.1 HD domain-containing protein [Flavobacteriales bacterium]